ncbi:MAG: GatB/YqeY domain-containing protein [Verrucomicrobiota bacterium]
MDFQERIDQDIKEAMKAKQAERLGVLRMLKSALKNAAIEQGGAEARLDDAAAQLIVRKELKKRQDAIEGFEKGGRPELAAKERDEALLLNTYLPQQLSAEELEALVKACVEEIGATTKAQMGQVMKLAVEKAAGRADGRALSAAISAKLS